MEETGSNVTGFIIPEAFGVCDKKTGQILGCLDIKAYI
jgi:hypothetical protein